MFKLLFIVLLLPTTAKGPRITKATNWLHEVELTKQCINDRLSALPNEETVICRKIMKP